MTATNDRPRAYPPICSAAYSDARGRWRRTEGLICRWDEAGRGRSAWIRWASTGATLNMLQPVVAEAARRLGIPPEVL